MYLKIMITIRQESGSVSTSVQELDGTDFSIGRSHCDIIIKHRYCSRKHAQISQDERGNLWLSDLGSANGVFVEGEKIEKTRLLPGKKIQLGSAILEVLSTSVWRKRLSENNSEPEEDGQQEASLLAYL